VPSRMLIIYHAAPGLLFEREQASRGVTGREAPQARAAPVQRMVRTLAPIVEAFTCLSRATQRSRVESFDLDKRLYRAHNRAASL
jgi:hypothetical protein